MEQEKISYPSNLKSNNDNDKKRDEEKEDNIDKDSSGRGIKAIDLATYTGAFIVILLAISLINPIMIQMSASNDTYGSMLFGGSTITQTKRCIINDIEVNCSTIPKIAGGDGP